MTDALCPRPQVRPPRHGTSFVQRFSLWGSTVIQSDTPLDETTVEGHSSRSYPFVALAFSISGTASARSASPSVRRSSAHSSSAVSVRTLMTMIPSIRANSPERARRREFLTVPAMGTVMSPHVSRPPRTCHCPITHSPPSPGWAPDATRRPPWNSPSRARLRRSSTAPPRSEVNASASRSAKICPITTSPGHSHCIARFRRGPTRTLGRSGVNTRLSEGAPGAGHAPPTKTKKPPIPVFPRDRGLPATCGVGCAPRDLNPEPID